MLKPKIIQGDRESRLAYHRWHYAVNSEKYLAASYTARKKRRIAVIEFFLSYLEEHPCVDCGETDPIVLEFDHRPDETKSFNVSEGLKHRTIAVIAAEIAKCDVRCANCHRRVTYHRAGRTHRTRV